MKKPDVMNILEGLFEMSEYVKPRKIWTTGFNLETTAVDYVQDNHNDPDAQKCLKQISEILEDK